MILIDALERWLYMSLFSTQNLMFVRLFNQIIWFWAQFFDYAMNIIHLDNTNKSTSKAFNNYCMTIEIIVEYLEVYSFINWFK